MIYVCQMCLKTIIMVLENARTRRNIKINSAQTQAADKLEILKREDIFTRCIDGPWT